MCDRILCKDARRRIQKTCTRVGSWSCCSSSSVSSHRNNESTKNEWKTLYFSCRKCTIVDNRWSDGRATLKKCCRDCLQLLTCFYYSHHSLLLQIYYSVAHFRHISFCSHTNKIKTNITKPFKMNQNKNVWRFAVSVSPIQSGNPFRRMHHKMIYIIHNE